MKTDEIYTERLILKPLELTDASFMLQLLNTPNWLQYIGDREVHSIEDAEQYLEKGSLKSLKNDGYGYYLLTEKESQNQVGICGLGKREGLEETDLGFALLPKYEGKGFAYESSIALIAAAKEKFNLTALMAITTDDNIGSRKLLEKLNFQFTAKEPIAEGGTEFLQYRLIL